MADVPRLLLYVLAIFRYSILLYKENGPFYVFDWLRYKAGIRIVVYRSQNVVDGQLVRDDAEIRTGDGFFAELLNCPYCLSFWIAVPMLMGWKKKWPLFEAIAVYGAVLGCVYWLLKWDED